MTKVPSPETLQEQVAELTDLLEYALPSTVLSILSEHEAAQSVALGDWEVDLTAKINALWWLGLVFGAFILLSAWGGFPVPWIGLALTGLLLNILAARELRDSRIFVQELINDSVQSARRYRNSVVVESQAEDSWMTVEQNIRKFDERFELLCSHNGALVSSLIARYGLDGLSFPECRRAMTRQQHRMSVLRGAVAQQDTSR